MVKFGISSENEPNESDWALSRAVDRTVKLPRSQNSCISRKKHGNKAIAWYVTVYTHTELVSAQSR